MKKKYLFPAVVAIAVLNAGALPVVFASTQGTSYTHPDTPITNLPNQSQSPTANATVYTHPSVNIVNEPRQPVKPGHGLSPNTLGSVTNYGWAASNWSGYAVTGSTYNDITGNWTVPTVSQSKGNTYSSSWIGIDGYSNSDLIQTGTEQDYVHGHAQYDAWWEILPAAETVITSMVVSPGDQMSAHIHNNGNGTWTIRLNDVTRNESFTTTQAYTGPGTSAEWIQEAPEINGQISTLAHYGQTTFDPGTVNGASPQFNSNDAGYMDQNNTVVSSVSNPDSDVDGFNAAYGSTQPAAPQS